MKYDGLVFTKDAFEKVMDSFKPSGRVRAAKGDFLRGRGMAEIYSIIKGARRN